MQRTPLSRVARRYDDGHLRHDSDWPRVLPAVGGGVATRSEPLRASPAKGEGRPTAPNRAAQLERYGAGAHPVGADRTWTEYLKHRGALVASAALRRQTASHTR